VLAAFVIKYLWTVGMLLLDYTAQHPRRQSLYTHLRGNPTLPQNGYIQSEAVSYGRTNMLKKIFFVLIFALFNAPKTLMDILYTLVEYPILHDHVTGNSVLDIPMELMCITA
jgi:hypothetical protein